MTRKTKDNIGKVAYALLFSAIPAACFYDATTEWRGVVTVFFIIFSTHLILFKLNEILDAIKNKDKPL